MTQQETVKPDDARAKALREVTEQTLRAMDDVLDLTNTETIRRIIYNYEGTCAPLNRTSIEAICQALDTARGHKAVMEAAERQLLKDLGIDWPPGEPFLAIVADEIERLRAAVELAINFHSADTEAFVKRYGTGMTTRDLCDHLRAYLPYEPVDSA